MKNNLITFPDILYVDSYMNLSPKQGIIKTFTYVLKRMPVEKDYIDNINVLYKMSGLNLAADMREFMNNFNEVLVSYKSSSNWFYILANPEKYYNKNLIAVYKIIGRNVPNANRINIDKKTKATLKIHEKAVNNIPLLIKLTTNSVTLNRKILLEYINKELIKKGHSSLSDKVRIDIG